jgi:hypothetical protein
MRDDQQCPDTPDSAARKARKGPRNLIKTCRRSGGLAVLAVATAIPLAAFGATSSAHDARPGKSPRSGDSRASSKTNRSRARSASALPNDDAARLLNEWTACEQSQGDSGQAEPTVAHEVIHVTPPTEAMPPRDPGDATATQFEYPSKACGHYLTAAGRAAAGGPPVEGWGDHADYVEYANCMRANGYPTYPYPSGIEPDGHESTNFNGTGINPESPALLNGSANQTCGRQIGAPAWWINNWGPPGSVEVARGPLPTGYPPFSSKPILVPGADGGPGGNSGS